MNIEKLEKELILKGQVKDPIWDSGFYFFTKDGVEFSGDAHRKSNFYRWEELNIEFLKELAEEK